MTKRNMHHRTRLRIVELQDMTAIYAKMARDAREQFLEYRGWPRVEELHRDRFITYSRRAAQSSEQVLEMLSRGINKHAN